MRFAIVTLCFLFISVGAWADIEMQPFEHLKVKMGDSRSKVMSVIKKSGAKNIEYSDSRHTISTQKGYGNIDTASYVYYFNEQDRLIAVVVYIHVNDVSAVATDYSGITPRVPSDNPSRDALYTAIMGTIMLYEMSDLIHEKYDSCGNPYQVLRIDDKRIIRISVRSKFLHIQYSNEGIVE